MPSPGGKGISLSGRAPGIAGGRHLADRRHRGRGRATLYVPVGLAAYAVDWPAYAQAVSPDRDTAFVRENVTMLATKVGTLQAKLASIDGLGRRVAQVAGVAYTDPELATQLQGMPEEATHVMDDLFTDRQPPSPATAADLAQQLDEIQVRMAQQADNLRLLDAALTRRSADKALLPSAMPITEYPTSVHRMAGAATR